MLMVLDSQSSISYAWHKSRIDIKLMSDIGMIMTMEFMNRNITLLAQYQFKILDVITWNFTQMIL